MNYEPGHTARVGDVCMRIVPDGNSLNQGSTYTITKVNLASARGLRADGKSINQSFKSIVVVKRAPYSKWNQFLDRCKQTQKAIKAIWR